MFHSANHYSNIMHMCWVDNAQLWFVMSVTRIVGVAKQTKRDRTKGQCFFFILIILKVNKTLHFPQWTGVWVIQLKTENPDKLHRESDEDIFALGSFSQRYFSLDSVWENGKWKQFLPEIKIKLLHSMSLCNAGNGSVKSSFQTIFWLNHSDFYVCVSSGDAAIKENQETSTIYHTA